MKEVLNKLSLAIETIDTVARIVMPAKREEAAEVLETVKGLFDSLGAHQEGAVTAAQVRAEMRKALDKLKDNDRAADEALAKKFPDE